MAIEKKISAKEAAVAVLKKAEEMLKNSTLLKAEKLAKDDGATINSQIGFPFGKDEKAALPHAQQKDVGQPDGIQKQIHPAADPHVQAANNNAETAAGMPGSLKLAKFIGHMEAKRKMKTAAPAVSPVAAANAKIPG